MCLGIPAQIVRIDDAERMLATAEVGGVRRQVNIICIVDDEHPPESCVGDWVLLHVRVVTTIYRAVSNVVQSLGDQGKGPRFQRVVLVEFPHPGMRALAFVTNALRDATTDRTILCVCVLTGVVPPEVAEATIREAWPSVAAFPGIANLGRKLTGTIILAPLAWLVMGSVYFGKLLPPLVRRCAVTNRLR